MLIKEDHDSSFVDDGIDVVSKLQVIVTPAEEPASLADAALAKLTLKPTPEMTHLTFECPDGSWRCQHDRRWYVHHQRAKNSAVVLRLLDRGMLSGQCNLSSLPSREPEKLVSLEEFQDDVRRALGKSFGEFIEAGQSANEANYRVYRVVVHGTSSDIAMRWIYYLVADPQGRQVALTFTVEQALLDRFADADKAMVSRCGLPSRKRSSGNPPAKRKNRERFRWGGSCTTGWGGSCTATPEVATAEGRQYNCHPNHAQRPLQPLGLFPLRRRKNSRSEFAG